MNKKNPYPHNNYARTEDFLEELILWGSGERGRIPIAENENGFETLAVNDSEAKALTVPDDAVSAEIHIEADATTAKPRSAIRYKQNGTAPTANTGMRLGDEDIIEVYGKANLDKFKAIGIEAGKTHQLQIQYYQSAQINGA